MRNSRTQSSSKIYSKLKYAGYNNYTSRLRKCILCADVNDCRVKH